MSNLIELTTGYGLVEGPVWEDGYGLLFSDVIYGGVYALNDSGEVRTVIEHRRGIGGMAFHIDGGVIVSGKNIAHKSLANQATTVLLDNDPENDNVGYNDITTDPRGRIYAGSLGSSPVFEDGREPTPGKLYLIDLDGSSRIVADDVELTNGLGVSPDEAWLYHADSRRQEVYKYRVHEDGSLEPRKTFVQFDDGAPDGLAVADDGSVWIANASAGQVEAFEPNGSLRARITVPVPMCTSVCFGGSNLDRLYIVTGSNGLDTDRGGGVYVCEPGVRGVPLTRAQINVRALD